MSSCLPGPSRRNHPSACDSITTRHHRRPPAFPRPAAPHFAGFPFPRENSPPLRRFPHPKRELARLRARWASLRQDHKLWPAGQRFRRAPGDSDLHQRGRCGRWGSWMSSSPRICPRCPRASPMNVPGRRRIRVSSHARRLLPCRKGMGKARGFRPGHDGGNGDRGSRRADGRSAGGSRIREALTGTENREGPHRKRWGPSTLCPVRHWRRIRDSNRERLPPNALSTCSSGGSGMISTVPTCGGPVLGGAGVQPWTPMNETGTETRVPLVVAGQRGIEAQW